MVKKLDTVRDKAVVLGEEAKTRWHVATEKHTTFGVAEQLYERDQSAFASVLGSAIALRLFLFVIPANVAIIGLINLLRLGSLFNKHFEESVTTGDIATALDHMSWVKSLGVFLSGTAAHAVDGPVARPGAGHDLGRGVGADGPTVQGQGARHAGHGRCVLRQHRRQQHVRPAA